MKGKKLNSIPAFAEIKTRNMLDVYRNNLL